MLTPPIVITIHVPVEGVLVAREFRADSTIYDPIRDFDVWWKQIGDSAFQALCKARRDRATEPYGPS